MTVTLIGTNGLFTRLGKLVGMNKRIKTMQGQLMNDSDGAGQCYRDVLGTYATSAAQNETVRWLGLINEHTEASINSTNTLFVPLANSMFATLINMVKEDSGSRYGGDNVELAFKEVLRQMIAAGVGTASFDGNTITVGTLAADSGNKGDGTVVTHTSPSAIFAPSVTAFPAARTETISFNCYKDAQDKSVKSGTELFDIRGGTKYSNNDYRFPGGGGYYGRTPAISESISSKRGECQQHLFNGGFESVVSNVPVNWTIATGTAGSDVESETTSVYRGSKALKITGNGSVLHKIEQQFGSIGGTTSTLKPDTVYVIAAAVKRGSVSMGSGGLNIECVDSGGTVLGAKGTNVRLTVACALLTTSYVRHSVTVRTPKDMPSNVTFRLNFDVAIPNTGEVFIDSVIMAPLKQLAPGGIYVGILAGSDDYAEDDKFDQPITNNQQGEWLTELDRFFDLHGSGICPPVETDGTETIADSLIS